jgi:hypothetical protein
MAFDILLDTPRSIVMIRHEGDLDSVANTHEAMAIAAHAIRSKGRYFLIDFGQVAISVALEIFERNTRDYMAVLGAKTRMAYVMQTACSQKWATRLKKIADAEGVVLEIHSDREGALHWLEQNSRTAAAISQIAA